MSTSTRSTLGLPYQGSKSRITDKIVELLPAAPIFVDVFAGGCAVTHAALLSGKFGEVIANDLSDAPQLFYYCAKYGVPEKPSWVSREDFFALKDRAPLIRYVYSFGNDGGSYLYGREIEPLKRAAHRAVVDGDYSGLPEPLRGEVAFELNALGGAATLHARRRLFVQVVHAQIARRGGLECLQRLQHLEHLQRLQRLQHLQNLARLVTSRRDYHDLYIPDNAVVYCDPPYANTTGYGIDFDHRAFYAWCRSVGKRHPLFVSEYWMPSDFRCVAEYEVRALARPKAHTQTRVEKIFTI